MKFAISETIACTLADAFALLAEFTRDPEWKDDCVSAISQLPCKEIVRDALEPIEAFSQEVAAAFVNNVTVGHHDPLWFP